ncbi:hypothetical protein [Amycolatopsis sp. PS_44_ISF1]|uniref:hypothetical protein n=1 Tax=Amycolatopsis sp. PS_44_ISF1 TaxID=2974917 RepID=UPI0028DF2D81|nr:hypothetical protein [Amycolatopsis sp. PS_44_ISF1]MDT8911935.1 hypothetical protein [Amycolatopsis sp. PS_44_ISF1]
MSKKRTLLSALLFAPLCLALPGTALAAGGPTDHNEVLPATIGWWPGGSSSQEDSVVFAGIGGAGALHHKSGTDGWGNHWSEGGGAVAGIGGAAVLHSERHSHWGGHRPQWPAGDDLRTRAQLPAPARKPVVTAAPVKAAEPVATKTEQAEAAPAETMPARTVSADRVADTSARPARDVTTDRGLRGHRHSRPVHHDSDASFHEGTTIAGPTGASSWDVASAAGRDHAWYSASALTAGPQGAASNGTVAVAVPEAAGYKSWNVAAGPTGSYSHSTEASAHVLD